MSIRFEDNVTPLNADNLNQVVDFTRQAHSDIADLHSDTDRRFRHTQRLFNEFLVQFGSAITVGQARGLRINVGQARNEKTLTVVNTIIRGYPLLRDLENRLAQ